MKQMKRERERVNNSKCHKGPSKLQRILGKKVLPEKTSREEL